MLTYLIGSYKKDPVRPPILLNFSEYCGFLKALVDWLSPTKQVFLQPKI